MKMLTSALRKKNLKYEAFINLKYKAFINSNID